MAEKPGVGHNSKQAKEFEKRLMSLYDEMESETGRIRSDIKEVYRECKKKTGIPTKAMKMAISEKRAEMKREKARAEWTQEERDTYVQLSLDIGITDEVPSD